MKWVELAYDNRSFQSVKTAIVLISENYTFVNEYRNAAKRKLCERLGLKENEVYVPDCRLLGSDVLFIE